MVDSSFRNGANQYLHSIQYEFGLHYHSILFNTPE